MKIRVRKDITRVIREDRKAVDDAVAKGVRDAMLRHKKKTPQSSSSATARSSG